MIQGVVNTGKQRQSELKESERESVAESWGRKREETSNIGIEKRKGQR